MSRRLQKQEAVGLSAMALFYVAADAHCLNCVIKAVFRGAVKAGDETRSEGKYGGGDQDTAFHFQISQTQAKACAGNRTAISDESQEIRMNGQSGTTRPIQSEERAQSNPGLAANSLY